LLALVKITELQQNTRLHFTFLTALVFSGFKIFRNSRVNNLTHRPIGRPLDKRTGVG